MAALFLPNYYLGDTHNAVEDSSSIAANPTPSRTSPPSPVDTSPAQLKEATLITAETVPHAPIAPPSRPREDERAPLMESSPHSSYLGSSSDNEDRNENRDAANYPRPVEL